MDEGAEIGEMSRYGVVAHRLKGWVERGRDTPLERYKQAIQSSVFRDVGALKEVAHVCKVDGIPAAHTRLLGLLQEEGVSYLPIMARPEGINSKTAIINGRKYIYYPDDISSRSEVCQLVGLSHKYKSLKLREKGVRGQTKVALQILTTDIAFLEFLKVLPKTTEGEKREILRMGKEYESRIQMVTEGVFKG